jgi:putative methanogenesis marker protein 8
MEKITHVSFPGKVPDCLLLLCEMTILNITMGSDGQHVIEAAGKARVVIREGKVVSVGRGVLASCPLAARFATPVTSFSEDEIRANIEGRIKAFGMCTRDRVVLCDDDFVLFGASELFSAAVRGGIIDCAVLACDGAGTVITPIPRMIQGIGGKMSGLVATTPLPEVISRIEAQGGYVVTPETGAIDMAAGVRAAYAKGYRHVAVTTASAAEAHALRNDFPEVLITAVHTTGMGDGQALVLADTCDLIFPCASGSIRKIAGPRAHIQGGTAVPVYAMTSRGCAVILEKIRSSGQQVLIKGASLPFDGGKGPSPLF